LARQKVIGLTGPTGAGKTTVSKALEQKGYNIIDADQVARKVVLPAVNACFKIAGVFGGEVLNPDQSLNRQALGRIVFSSKDKLKQLRVSFSRTSFMISTMKSKVKSRETI
jgi:dephospho-CoA kinase